jgi:hypothetical protein
MARHAVTAQELECTRGWATEVMHGAAHWASSHNDRFARFFNRARSDTGRANAVAEKLGFCPRYFRQVLKGTRAMSRPKFLELARTTYELGWTDVHHHPDLLEFRYRPGRRAALQDPSDRKRLALERATARKSLGVERLVARKRLRIKRATARAVAVRLAALSAICPSTRPWRPTVQRIASNARRWDETRIDSALRTLAKAIAESSHPLGTRIELVQLPGLHEDFGSFSPQTTIALEEAFKWRGLEWRLTMAPSQ